jgi:UPF0271 protein
LPKDAGARPVIFAARFAAMTRQVNLNADMGESYGAYKMGQDELLLKVVRSASIACGFHAGDPTVMHELVMRARDEGVSIGAHPGFNDLWGFGRRRIDTGLRDLEYMVAYQIGALQAMAQYASLRVTHVKAHGALSNMAAEDIEIALAVARAVKTVDRGLICLAVAGTQLEAAARKLGLPLAREGFCDRSYEDDGNLTPRKIAGAVIADPQAAKENALKMVLDGEIISRSGKRVALCPDSLCVHGDEPNAYAVARAVREGLEAAGVRVVPLSEMKLA